MSDPAPDQMALPPGKSCRDCHHLRRCLWLLYIHPNNQTCDFCPSRFAPYIIEKEQPHE